MARNLGGADVNVRVRADATDTTGTLDRVDGKLGALGGTLGRVGGLAAGAFAVDKILDFGVAVVGAASDAEQALGAVQAIFGSTAEDVIRNSESAATAVGLSATSYQELASVFGASLGNMGFASEELAGESDRLIALGADLAAQFGGSTSDAVGAITSLFRGAGDPIERFGVSIRQSDVNARLLEQGLTGLTGEAQKNAELTARMELLYEQTAAAQGAFGRESETLAGRQARLTAQFDDFKVELGNAVMPTILELFDIFSEDLMPAIQDLLPVITELIRMFAADLKPVIEIVSGVLRIVAGILTGDFALAWEGAKGVVEGFVNAARNSINRFIDIWNALDIGIRFTPPAWLASLGVGSVNISDIFPDIPRLALGGIVTSPTVAMIGEAGPEAVVPLDRYTGGGRPLVLNIYPGVAQSPPEVGRAVVEAIRAYEADAGAAWRETA